jgi:hypothetical protein
MARTKKIVVTSENVSKVIKDTKEELAKIPDAKEHFVIPIPISGDSAMVYLKDGSKRYYSRRKDGAIWKVLAKNYAEANGGKFQETELAQ